MDTENYPGVSIRVKAVVTDSILNLKKDKHHHEKNSHFYFDNYHR